MKKITVFGATGMIGTPVTNELVKAGFEVTALVRNIEKAKQIFPSGVNFVKGDLDNLKSIAEAMQNADAIYINISTTDKNKENEFNPEIGGLDNILATAKENNIKQIAYLSSFLARNYQGNWWVMNAKKASISKVKICGIPYTIFYPSNFMENFKGGMVQGKKISGIGKSIHKAWWIAGEDFGKQVANAFKTEKALNNEYPVQGLEPLTMDEAANIYVQNYSKEKMSVSNLPMGFAKFLAVFISPLKFVTQLMTVMNNNVETFEAQKTWNDLGTSEMTVAKFAQK